MVTVYLTTREHNKLSTGQAHAVLAATLLRHLHAVITIGQRWDPAIAASGRPRQPMIAADQQQATLTAGASPTRHRDLWISAHIQGSPAPRHANPITRCRAPFP